MAKTAQVLLDIRDLHIGVEGQEIIHGVDLKIQPGEIHVIMGPNGSGKTTLSSALMGHPRYKILGGKVKLKGRDLLKMSPDERASAGLFLAFQYPKEIPGVSLLSFLRTAYNAVLKARKGKKFEPLSLYSFKKFLQEKVELVGLPRRFLERSINEGFSGGEKKKSEILQMAVLEPDLAILDETDSGLDIDALKNICHAITKIKKKSQSLLVVTHYERMLKYLKPDFVHIMMEGRVVESGGKELAKKLEKYGYEPIRLKILS